MQDIQSKVNNGTYGLQAIKNAITGVKTDTQIIRGDLFSFKTNAEPKLNTIQTTTTSIDTKVTDIQSKITTSGSGGLKGIHWLKTITVPAASGTTSGTATLEVLPAVTGKIYAGHINFHFAGSNPGRTVIGCGFGGGSAYDSGSTFTPNEGAQLDFTCPSVSLIFINTNPFESTSQIQVVASYQEVPATLVFEN